MPTYRLINSFFKTATMSAVIALLLCTSVRADQPTLHIVTTSTIVADLARNVVGPFGRVTSLVKIGDDPHTFHLTPEHLKAIARADVVLLHGAGLDRHVADKLNPASTSGIVRVVTDGLHPRENNPHFWFDPELVRVYVRNIARAVQEADPLRAFEYMEHSNAYEQRLQQLDQWIENFVRSLPIDKRKIVAHHDTLRYFALKYDFSIVAVLLDGSAVEVQPSARRLSRIVQTIKHNRVPALFSDVTLSSKMMETIAQELDYSVAIVPLYTDSLSDDDGPAPTYMDFMRYNVVQIIQALRPVDENDVR